MWRRFGLLGLFLAEEWGVAKTIRKDKKHERETRERERAPEKGRKKAGESGSG